MTLPVFPELAGIAFPARRTPLWRTLKQEAASGKEARLALWSFPRWRWELAYDLLRADANAEWQALAGFFNAVQGAALPFEFADPDDGGALGQSLGLGDGATTVFAFVRALGGFVEPIQDVIASSVSLYVNGAHQGTGYTLLATALGTVYAVEFASPPAPGAAISADFAWRWLCRFDDDSAAFEKFARDFWELKTIAFTSLKQ